MGHWSTLSIDCISAEVDQTLEARFCSEESQAWGFWKKNFIKLKCGISCPESLMPSHVETALLSWMLSGSVSREAPSAMMSGGTGLRLGLSCDQTELAMRGLSLHQEEVKLGLWGSGSSKIWGGNPQSDTPTLSFTAWGVNPVSPHLMSQYTSNLWTHIKSLFVALL